MQTVTVHTDDIYSYIEDNKSELTKDHPEIFLKAISGRMINHFTIKRHDDKISVYFLFSDIEGDE
jgi:hypothetical protein